MTINSPRCTKRERTSLFLVIFTYKFRYNYNLTKTFITNETQKGNHILLNRYHMLYHTNGTYNPRAKQ